jgi:hypothetical protein
MIDHLRRERARIAAAIARFTSAQDSLDALLGQLPVREHAEPVGQ